MFSLDELDVPIVQAPLAGGPSTPALAIAVSQAGGLGFVAAGYKTGDAVKDDIDTIRAATGKPFGVNIFVPSPAPAEPASLTGYLDELRPEAERQGVAVGDPRYEDDDWQSKLELVIDERAPVASFTFGLPVRAAFDALHAADIAVWVTITNAEEARMAQAAGADALVVQGTEAGGHRGGFSDDDETAAGIGLLALLALTKSATALPLIAAGGIADGATLAAVLVAGASAAQIGTALMLSPEASTNPAHREAIRERRATALTRAFTGRSARGIENRFMQDHRDAPTGYPEIHHATAPIRAAARQRRDADGFNLWAGQAHELAQELPAGEIVRRLGEDARRALVDASRRYLME